jgi:hypothetical protein
VKLPSGHGGKGGVTLERLEWLMILASFDGFALPFRRRGGC